MALFRDNRRIRRAKSGDGYDVRLPDDERELLASLPQQLVELLDATAGDAAALEDDPALARLFPDAYSAADTDLADEYRRLMTDDLRDRHRVALETLAAGAHAERIDHDELYAWMTALTQLRLVLGTRLGVTEDMVPSNDDPAFALYSYLSWLQEQIVEALSST
jgi:hypothetical protein